MVLVAMPAVSAVARDRAADLTVLLSALGHHGIVPGGEDPTTEETEGRVSTTPNRVRP